MASRTTTRVRAPEAAAPEPGTGTRERILDAAGRLFRRQGYAATGLKEIVTEGGAPIGSLYHFFPGGKEELGVEALLRIGTKLQRVIAGVADADDMAASVEAFFKGSARRLRESGFQDGCPVATVCVEVASANERIRQTCEDIFESWRVTLADAFAEAGAHDADSLATFVLASHEGALVLSRALRDTQPLTATAVAVGSVLRDRLP